MRYKELLEIGEYSEGNILKQKIIRSSDDILEADIIDFNRLNGVWENSLEALKTITSWLKNMAVITYMNVPEFLNTKKTNTWPGWDHIGNHPKIGEQYWYWFHENFPGGKLEFSDAPDFYGWFKNGTRFWGDIGKVSASTFAFTQKEMRRHSLWISIPDDGTQHIIIESLVDISEIHSAVFIAEMKGGSGKVTEEILRRAVGQI